jgi:hypothetical protein
MAWDKSNGMYYRSHRNGKKVTREYFGNGEAARLAAGLDDRKRRRKQAEISAAKVIKHTWETADRVLAQWQADTHLLLRAVRLIARCRRQRKGGPSVDA